MKNLPYTLGLDIGMASVGAALLQPDQQRILALHVRTFDKAETDKEGESLNKIRRQSRLTRRRIRRRAHRLLRLARLMKLAGLIDEARPDAFALPCVTPWTLRAEGLNRLLQPKEWAAVIYHIIKHRGFQSNKKSEAKTDAKVGEMLTGVNRNKELLKSYRTVDGRAAQTVGELAALHEDFKEAKRNKGGNYTHTFSREDLQHELKTLFEKQRGLGNTFAATDFEEKIIELLLARRPPLSGDRLMAMVGKCTFENTEHRAPKASYRAERFIWLGKLNNLKIVGRGDFRPLGDAERNAIMHLPFSQSKLTYKQVRKALGLEVHQRFNLLSYRVDGKDKDPEETTFFEARTYHALRKTYEEAGLAAKWKRDSADADRLDTLAYALTCFKEDDESRKWLASQGVEASVVEAVLNLSFEKFIHLSQTALKKILPFMESGQRYDEAARSAGYNHSQPDTSGDKQRYLPPPDKDAIRNPVVFRALNQARKLVNAVVREYGPPAAVHIELARDLSRPFDERKRIEKEQDSYRKRKLDDAADFEDRFRHAPVKDDLTKWRLCREQLDQCPYCQKALDIQRLFKDNYSQIDHILPQSRSFEDELNNKVVVHTQCNQNKGNRTPFEYMGGEADSPRWQTFVAWVEGNKNIRQAKRNRLLRKNFGDKEAKEFSKRNLNDTRYICTEFMRMVETYLQWHPDAKVKERCVVLSGRLTSLLRHRWGLLKERESGDLHHALDAAVIAAASRGLVKRMSDYSRRKELEMVGRDYIDPETGEVMDSDALSRLERDFPKPWPHFRRELQARLSPDPAGELAKIPGYDKQWIADARPVRVSRAPTRRGLGAAHQETIRSTGAGGKLLAQGLSSAKVALTDLKFSDIEKIAGVDDPRNKKWIDELRSRLKPHKGEDNKKGKCAGAKAFAHGQPRLIKPSGDGKNAPRIRSVKLIDVQKRGVPVRNGIADNASMLRADIFTKNKKFFAVPVYVADAVKRELPDQAVLQGAPEEQWPVMDDTYTFLFSLYPNDWVTLRLKNEVREGYFSSLHSATGNINIWLHDRNQKTGKKGMLEGNGIKTALAVEKYHVDFLGRLYRVRQEERQAIRLKRRKG